MKSRKGIVDVLLFGSLIMVCLVINGINKPYNAEDRADIQKSFGQKQGNVITAFSTYSNMTDEQKKEFDKSSPNSPTYW